LIPESDSSRTLYWLDGMWHTTTWFVDTQQARLTAGIASAAEGTSVAVSANGNVIVSGAPDDSDVFIYVGPTPWILTQTIIGGDRFGFSVAISADGVTIAAGAPDSSGAVGAVLVYILSGGTYIQQGPILVGSGEVGTSRQGTSIALSSSGDTLAVGGPCKMIFVSSVHVF
jgi:hypothetical protein